MSDACICQSRELNKEDKIIKCSISDVVKVMSTYDSNYVKLETVKTISLLPRQLDVELYLYKEVKVKVKYVPNTT